MLISQTKGGASRIESDDTLPFYHPDILHFIPSSCTKKKKKTPSSRENHSNLFVPPPLPPVWILSLLPPPTFSPFKPFVFCLSFVFVLSRRTMWVMCVVHRDTSFGFLPLVI